VGKTPDELDGYTVRPYTGGDNDPDIHRIKDNIEQTRAEMSGTIDTIQERLAPQVLVEQAKDAARDAGSHLMEETKTAIVEATVQQAERFVGKAEQVVNDMNYTAREASDSMLDTIRRNPLPATMAAVGIGWLWMRRRESNGWSSHPRMGERRMVERGSLSSFTNEAKDRVDELTDNASSIATGIADDASTIASEATQRAGRIASSATSTATDAGMGVFDAVKRNPVPAALAGISAAWLIWNREETRFRPVDVVSSRMEPVGALADKARSQVGDLGVEAQSRARVAQSQFDRWLQDMPLAIGAAALGLGAAIGLALPTTSKEREILGDARDSLVERTQQVAQDAQHRLTEVVERAQQAATEAASSDQGSGSSPSQSSTQMSQVI